MICTTSRVPYVADILTLDSTFSVGFFTCVYTFLHGSVQIMLLVVKVVSGRNFFVCISRASLLFFYS